MAEQKLVEDLLQSIQIVASGLDSKVNKDVTTLCEIVNIDRASEGIYIVKEQEAKYEAYSESKFEVGDQVYVTIPKGDYNEQKLIMGKKVAENTTPFNWISPFDSFFKIIDWNTSRATGVGDEGGLLANGTTEEIEVIPWTNANATGFDRLGLKAGFKNNLTSCVSGNYGLRLELQVTNYFDTNAKTTKIVPYVFEVADMWGNPYNFPSYFAQEKVFELESGKDTTIEKWRLIFFQDKGSFMDEDGNLYPIEIDTGIGQPTPMPNNLFVDDIEISLGYKTEETYGDKVYLFCANGTNYGSGNSTASVKAMFAEIAAMQSYLADPNTSATGRAYYEALISTYQEKIKTIITPEAYAVYMSKPAENRDSYLNSLHIDGINEKQLKVRWWHLDADNNGMIIDENNEFIVGASVNLYRFNSKATADELGGGNYELIGTHGPYENANGKRTPLDFTFVPNPNKAEEHLKAVIYKYGNEDRVDAEGEPVTDSQGNVLKKLEYAYSSDILVLTNDNGVKDETTTALRIKPEDDYRGIYNIYDATTWELTDITQGKIQRNVHLYFNSDNLSLKYLDRADSIVWVVPKAETMVVFDNMPAADLVVDTEDGLFTEYHYLTKYTHSADNTEEDYSTARLNVPYCIDFNYIAGYTNNIISCRVLRDGITYVAEFEFKFGMRGNVSDGNVIMLTLGDDYNENNNIIEPRAQAWTISSTTTTASAYISLIRHFYNKNGEELTPTWGELKYYAGDDIFKQVNITIRGTSIPCIQKKSSDNIDFSTTLGEIMSCDVTLDGIIYTVYLIIPIRSGRTIMSVNGPKQIYYDHDGYNPQGTDKYFSCWYNNEQHYFDEVVQKARSSIKKPSDAADTTDFGDCLPTIYSYGSAEKRYYLKAPGQFFMDLAPYSYSVNLKYDAGQWVQPILIAMNPYDNSILNEWDGKLKIDEENNYILASMMGAGWKDKENHFTGAIMGVVDDITQNTTQKLPSNTGLFGFDGGIGAFAFKADGTAYIGKAGTARINFDGNAGTIENAGYGNASSGGMHIDLTGNTNSGQRPWINMHAADGAAVYIGTGGGTAPTEANPDPIPRKNLYFRVKSSSGMSLIHIGNAQQFIQTNNYIEPTYYANEDIIPEGSHVGDIKTVGSGLKIDLSNGTLTGYGKLSIQGGIPGQNNSMLISTDNYRIAGAMAGQTGKQNWRLTIGSNFGVDAGGQMFASAGTIGGFNITTTAKTEANGGHFMVNSLYTQKTGVSIDNGSYDYEVGMQPTAGGEDLAFYVKRKNAGQPWTTGASGHSDLFYVKGNGTLYAANANITGTIYANGGNIGGCSITNGKLTVDSAHIGALYASDIGDFSSKVKSIVAETVTADYITGKHAVLGEMTVYEWGGVSIPDMLVVSGNAYFSSGVSVYGGGTYSGRYFTLSAADIQWIHTQRGV